LSEILKNRKFMHCPAFEGAMDESDQSKKITHPPHAKRAEDVDSVRGEIIALPDFDDVVVCDSYRELLDLRRSKRVYFDVPLTQAQLAFMLWSAIGIQEFRGANDAASLRPSPSGGARHPFNLYVVVQNVEGLEQGIYLYLPLENVGEKRVSIVRAGDIDDFKTTMTDMMAGQRWTSRAPAVLIATCDAYRAEWRYHTAAHRVMLIDLGHLGQNLMLSATSMGLGSCCLAAYDQALCDKVLGVDGIDEYTVYAISVGTSRD